MWKLWLFGSFTLLFYFAPPKKGGFFVKRASFQERIYAKALLFGDKTQLKAKDKKLFQKLHLSHLLVPSGLHLSVLVSFLSLFLKKKRVLKGFIGASSQLFSTLMSFKRMGLFYLLQALFPRLSLLRTWILALFIDYLRGSWSDSPLSFTLSFLFVSGILICHQKHLRIFPFLFFSSLYLSIHFNQTFYPINLIISCFSLPLHFLMYPLSFIDLLIQKNFFFSYYLEALSWIHQIFGFVQVESKLIKVFIFLLYLIDFKWMAFFYLLWPLNVSNIHPYFGKRTTYPSPLPLGWIDRVEKKSLTQYTYPSGMVCRARLYNESWSVRCRNY